VDDDKITGVDTDNMITESEEFDYISKMAVQQVNENEQQNGPRKSNMNKGKVNYK